MKVERWEYSGWSQFKSDLIPTLFRNEKFRSGHYLFRGCSDASWRLTTSFDRRYESLPPDGRVKLWRRLLQEFKDTCAERGVHESILSDDRRLLAFGQHYGLPTRILDWSLSPYIAAFFAFRYPPISVNPTHRVAIWVLDATSSIWSAELGVELLAPPAIENIRLLNQAGRFTYARTQKLSLEEYVEDFPATKERPLVQISIPAGEARWALPDLDAMGVNPIHLFPDMLGLTEAVSLRNQLGLLEDAISLP